MVKLADTPDLGSGSARIRGSSPLSGIFRVIGWESASREAIQSRGVKRVRFGGSSGGKCRSADDGKRFLV